MKEEQSKFVNPIDRDKITETPSTLPYAHTVGGVVIRPTEEGNIKGQALTAMAEQTDMQLNQIKEQIALLAQQAQAIQKRKDISIAIYHAKMSFEPLIGHTYYLYKKTADLLLLSMVAPAEWGRKIPFERYLATVKLLADHTWDILEENENSK